MLSGSSTNPGVPVGKLSVASLNSRKALKIQRGFS